jgi:hypothetical protein
VLNYFIGLTFLITSSPACAAIYQWFDGDDNGSLWLSNSIVEPYSDLSSEILWWANLENANLHHTDLMFTNLTFANLENANISSNNLSNANLFNANLENADMAFTNFAGADLQFSNLENANMFYADFTDTNLSNIQNWETGYWLAARYTENTIFPNGMDPTAFGMIELTVPTPGILCMASISLLLHRRRR